MKFLLRFFSCSIFFILFTGNILSIDIEKYVILITLDGLRPDAISNTNTPNIYRIMNKGSYTLNARTVYPSHTIPAHTSLVTGLDSNTHKIGFNIWDESKDHIRFDTIFSIGNKNNLKSSFYCGKNKLLFLLDPAIRAQKLCFNIYDNEKDILDNITNSFTSNFIKNKPQINFIHFPFPDRTGHTKGWMTDQYLESTKNTDLHLGRIIGFLESNGYIDKTLVIVTSDHGGSKIFHGSKSKEDSTIPWIAFGHSVKINYKIKRRVEIYDTAPTILYYLNLSIPDNLDGKPITEIFNESN